MANKLMDIGYSFSVAGKSSSFALTAGAVLFSFRNPSTAKYAIVKQLVFYIDSTVAATAIGEIVASWQIVRSFSVDNSNGTVLVGSPRDGAYGTALCTAMIASSAALTVGTRTPDSNRFSGISTGVAVSGMPTIGYSFDFENSPIILRTNEGLELTSRVSSPTSLTAATLVEIHWSEVLNNQYA
jgi:hypothetical protein